MAEISLADGNRADFASSDPPNLWVNRTALVKPGEKPEERPSTAAPLLPFSIRGRLLRGGA